MEKILFATDGSEFSEHAASLVKEYLQAWPEAKLTILYVTAKENYAYDLIPEAVDKYEKQIAKQIEQDALEKWFALWKKRVMFLHLFGHPSTTICQVAEEDHSDIIIVGSHGRGAIDRMLLGSVSQSVLHRTDRPVLVVR